mmetsp:Transcript_5001/g.4206  ORF Transcript_5001/g.4206 Transcript_5001/m.4206 type:complete len:96 (+) Transcript_5001:76-363(+)
MVSLVKYAHKVLFTALPFDFQEAVGRMYPESSFNLRAEAVDEEHIKTWFKYDPIKFESLYFLYNERTNMTDIPINGTFKIDTFRNHTVFVEFPQK